MAKSLTIYIKKFVLIQKIIVLNGLFRNEEKRANKIVAAGI